MHYEVWLNGSIYYTNIKSKKAAMKIGKRVSNMPISQYVEVYQKFPETKESPSHTVILASKVATK